MKYSELSTLKTSEILGKLKDLRQELFESRMKNSVGQLSNPMIIRQARKDIARMKFLLSTRARSEKESKTVSGKEGN